MATEINADELLKRAIMDGVQEGVRSRLSASYGNPMDTIFKSALERHTSSLTKILEDSITSCISDEKFRDDIAVAVRSNLAKTLIQRFGGEIEKQVNVLKSDPTTRARITLAIEEIVKSSKV